MPLGLGGIRAQRRFPRVMGGLEKTYRGFFRWSWSAAVAIGTSGVQKSQVVVPPSAAVAAGSKISTAAAIPSPAVVPGVAAPAVVVKKATTGATGVVPKQPQQKQPPAQLDDRAKPKKMQQKTISEASFI